MPIGVSVSVLLPKHAGNHGPHVDRLSVLNTRTHTRSHTRAAKIMRPSRNGKNRGNVVFCPLVTSLGSERYSVRTEG